MKTTHFEDRARTASRLLTERWYRDLTSEENADHKAVYLFTSGSIAELFRAFDFRIVLPEINALHCSRQNVAVEMIHHGESLGYSGDVCSYVKSDLGMMAGPPKGRAPFGTIPPPDFIVITHGGCSTYIKWAEALSREFGCPLVMVDIPFVREDRPTDYDHNYVRTQLEELIPLCEEMSGKSLDVNRLKEILKISEQTITLWSRLLEYGKLKPTPLDGYFEAIAYMAPLTILRGTTDALEYYKAAIKQMDERIEKAYSPVGQEQFRLFFEGSPPWPKLHEFWKMFRSWGAVGVASSYVRVTCACEGIQYGPDKPFDYLAELAAQSFYNWNLGKRRKFQEKLAREYAVDGFVMHSVRSCRPFSIGQLDLRNYFAREAGIPSLFLDSDLSDPRFFSETQIISRVNTFFEALEHRKGGKAARGA